MQKRTKVEWALLLAGLDFQILPLLPEQKSPEKGVAWGPLATTDPDIIKKWFEEEPDINYGVHPGDNYVVIDLDKKMDYPV